MRKSYIIFTFLFASVIVTSCKKDYLNTTPSNGVPAEVINAETSTLNSAVDGALQSLFFKGPNNRDDNFGQKAVDLGTDLAGRDMVMNLAGFGWFNRTYQYTEWRLIESVNNRPDAIWYFYYDIIKQANKILDVVDVAKGTQAERESIKGEMLGLRAYAYFYLINLYQQTYKGNESKPGVPVYTTAQSLEPKGRGTVKEVYDQMIADLTLAETLLTGKTPVSKAHMSVNVVQGFRARIALIMEDWPTAATYANKARQGYTLMSSSMYQSGISLISNPELMWGSQIDASLATGYASFFSHMDVATSGYASVGQQKKITKELYDSIKDGDVRKTTFIAPGAAVAGFPEYTQTKFHTPNPASFAGDYLYMRAGEMYLIEAEALSRQSKDMEAQGVLNELVKVRYPAYSADIFTGQALTDEILLQRRIELWGEGFGLLDIKRLNIDLVRPTGAGNHGAPSLDAVVYTLPAGDPKMVIWIPRRELDNNINIPASEQNP